MIIRVLPTQIPKFWELIKFSCVQADEVDKKDFPSYFNSLLCDLLSEKSQCWVRTNEKKELTALTVTKIVVDKVTGEKSLVMQVVYSWSRGESREWIEDANLLKAFAIKEKCNSMMFTSRNEAVYRIAKTLSFDEVSRVFKRKV